MPLGYSTEQFTRAVEATTAMKQIAEVSANQIQSLQALASSVMQQRQNILTEIDAASGLYDAADLAEVEALIAARRTAIEAVVATLQF